MLDPSHRFTTDNVVHLNEEGEGVGGMRMFQFCDFYFFLNRTYCAIAARHEHLQCIAWEGKDFIRA